MEGKAESSHIKGFEFTLMRTDGAIAACVVARDNCLYDEVSDLLLDATPIRWIVAGSRKKVVRVDASLRASLSAVFDRLDVSLNGKSGVLRKFLEGIRVNGYMAFLDVRVAKPDNDALVSQAYKILQECEVADMYDIYEYGHALQFIGPDDYRKCTCRFCHKSYPDVRFERKNAHAIPDALGNKLVFCNDECTSCNSSLSKVEKNLIHYLNYRRAKDQIPGKRGRLKTIYGQNYCVEGATGRVEISPDAIIADDGDNLTVKNLDAQLISHTGIYRALCKIAIDLMHEASLPDFATTVEWVRGTVLPHTVPNVYFAYRKSMVEQPIATLYVRKKDVVSSCCPHCLVALDIDDLRFYYIVPLALSDGTQYLKSDAIDAWMNMLIGSDSDNLGYDHIDMSDRIGKYSHVINNIAAADANIVDEAKFASAREKNHNSVDFQCLDCRKVKVINANVVELNLCSDADKLQHARIEHCSIFIRRHRCVALKQTGLFAFSLSIAINDVISGIEYFSATIHVNVRHTRPNDVHSITCGEISYHLVDYMTDCAVEALRTRVSAYLPAFDFNALPSLIAENALYYLPDDKITE